MKSPVDLQQLAVRREREPAADIRQRPRFVSRYLVPGILLLGFAALLGWAAWDTIVPARAVTVVPVLATRSVLEQESGTPLFRAAGWIEPRPTPVAVAALTEGIVKELLVVEDQQVEAGAKVALLIDEDAKLSLAQAQAEQKVRQAELEVLKAGTERELANLDFQARSAEARQQLAQAEFDNKSKLFLDKVVPSLAVDRARSELTSAKAQLEELQTRKRNLEREYKAQVSAAEARILQARLAVQVAELRLARMTVRAPRAGKVLALVARPGQRVMGQTGVGTHEISSVITLYDPARLQVRADVRLEDLPQVRPGQPVRIETAALPGGFVEGEVLFPTSQADIQKNTLQVKVALKNPPPVLRPDMLVEATFLAPDNNGKAKSSERARLLIPRALVEGSGKEARVWLADQAHGRTSVGSALATLRTIKLGPTQGPDLVEVTEGLTATDRIIVAGREGLRDGQRIRVTGEDATLGIGPRGGAPPASRPREGDVEHKGKH